MRPCPNCKSTNIRLEDMDRHFKTYKCIDCGKKFRRAKIVEVKEELNGKKSSNN